MNNIQTLTDLCLQMSEQINHVSRKAILLEESVGTLEKGMEVAKELNEELRGSVRDLKESKDRLEQRFSLCAAVNCGAKDGEAKEL